MLTTLIDRRPPDVRKHPELFVKVDGSWMLIDIFRDYTFSMPEKERYEMNKRWPDG